MKDNKYISSVTDNGFTIMSVVISNLKELLEEIK